MRETPLRNGHAPLPFVGRRTERARAAELLAALEEGHGGGLVVVGEPGVGKSRFLAEVLGLPAGRGGAGGPAAGPGVAVGRAACLPLVPPLPFDAVVELLRSLQRADPEPGISVPRSAEAD